MQIENNCNTTFNGLYLRQTMKKTLINETPEYVAKIAKIGEELKDINDFHLVLTGRIYSDCDYMVARPLVCKTEDLKNIDKLSRVKNLFLSRIENQRGQMEKLGWHSSRPTIFEYLYGEKSGEKYVEFNKLSVEEQAAETCKMLHEEAIKKKSEPAKQSLTNVNDGDLVPERSRQAISVYDTYKLDNNLENLNDNVEKGTKQKILEKIKSLFSK